MKYSLVDVGCDILILSHLTLPLVGFFSCNSFEEVLCVLQFLNEICFIANICRILLFIIYFLALV